MLSHNAVERIDFYLCLKQKTRHLLNLAALSLSSGIVLLALFAKEFEIAAASAAFRFLGGYGVRFELSKCALVSYEESFTKISFTVF